MVGSFLVGRGLSFGLALYQQIVALRPEWHSDDAAATIRTALAMIFKLAQAAEKNWRRLLFLAQPLHPAVPKPIAPNAT
jgi:hypothetical protein